MLLRLTRWLHLFCRKVSVFWLTCLFSDKLLDNLPEDKFGNIPLPVFSFSHLGIYCCYYFFQVIIIAGLDFSESGDALFDRLIDSGILEIDQS